MLRRQIDEKCVKYVCWQNRLGELTRMDTDNVAPEGNNASFQVLLLLLLWLDILCCYWYFLLLHVNCAF